MDIEKWLKENDNVKMTDPLKTSKTFSIHIKSITSIQMKQI